MLTASNIAIIVVMVLGFAYFALAFWNIARAWRRRPYVAVSPQIERLVLFLQLLLVPFGGFQLFLFLRKQTSLSPWVSICIIVLLFLMGLPRLRPGFKAMSPRKSD
jgi:uncharacterized membrane protein